MVARKSVLLLTKLQRIIKESNKILNQVGNDMHNTMNSLLQHGVQQSMNILGPQTFIGQTLQPFGIQPRLALSSSVNLPINNFIQQPSQQDLNKLLQLGLLQQSFIQNYAYTNCANYHPTIVPRAELHTKSISTPNLCEEIKNEILKHIQPADRHLLASKLRTLQVSQSTEDLSLHDRDTDSEERMGRGLKRPYTGPGQNHMWPPQQKRARSEERDQQHTSPPQRWPWGPHIPEFRHQEMSNVIMHYFEENKQTQDLYTSKLKLREALYAIMKGVFPYCGLYVVGSSMNGFGNSSSDMDLCLMLSSAHMDQKKEATEILRILYKALKKLSFLKDVNLIKAKVPILKFCDRISGVECDLNINNSVGINNTHLLNAYATQDWRVAPLVVFVKHWARTHNINDAKEGTISSYSLAMMVLHFLQVGATPPVIPCLHHLYPHKFDGTIDVRLLTLNERLPEYRSANTQTLGDLFMGFLHYYTQVFNFGRDAMSVRLGCVVPRDVIMRQNPLIPPSQWKCLCIEEPYDLSNTARSVYDVNTFSRVLRVFRASFGRLRSTGDLRSILDGPV